MTKFVYLGIDQTGALNSAKQPKPLPACLLKGKQVEFFYLNKLSATEIIEKIKLRKNQTLLICVDCVFGFPQDIKMTWRQALQLMKKNEVYGKKSAQAFFLQIGRGKQPRRKIEIEYGAQSVFAEKPFQKNIQTGTFRIWKDISKNENLFYVSALEKRQNKNQIPLFEGYPSMSWKWLFSTKQREPKKINEHLRNSFKAFPVKWTPSHQKQINKDPNLADAFVLALTMKLYKSQAMAMKPNKEGHILGPVVLTCK